MTTETAPVNTTTAIAAPAAPATPAVAENDKLARIEWGQQGAKLQSMADAWSLCTALARSGFFTDARDAAAAFAIVQAGAELGFDPFASLAGMYKNPKSGRLGHYAQFQLALIVRRGGRYTIKQNDHQGCIIEWWRNDWLKQGEYVMVGPSSFVLSDATRADLMGKDTYAKYARDMFFNRAVTRGRLQYFSDYFNGGGHDILEELLEDADPVERTLSQQTTTTTTTQLPPPPEKKKKGGSDKLKDAVVDVPVEEVKPGEAGAAAPVATSTTPAASVESKPASQPTPPTPSPSPAASPVSSSSTPSPAAGQTAAPTSAPAATPASATAETAKAPVSTSTTAAASAPAQASMQAGPGAAEVAAAVEAELVNPELVNPSPASSSSSVQTKPAQVVDMSPAPTSSPASASSSSTSPPASASAPASSPPSSPPSTPTGTGDVLADDALKAALEAVSPVEGETGMAAALKKMPAHAQVLTKFFGLWSSRVDATQQDTLKMACRRKHNIAKGKEQWAGVSDEQRTAVEKAYADAGLTL